MDNLEKSILATVSYFDIHKYPLTALEIHKWLYHHDSQDIKSYHFKQIADYLDGSDSLKQFLQTKNGYYFLAGRDFLINQRQKKYQISSFKSRVALRMAKIFCWLPFVSMVSACNNFGFNSLDKKSDIDFFIIAQKNKIYFVRLLTTILTILFGLRPKAFNKSNKICLSFYVADNNLNLSNIKICENDIYLQYWFKTLYPFFGFKKYFALLSANKAIINNSGDGFYNPCYRRKIIFPFKYRLVVDAILAGNFGKLVEKIAKTIQQKKINKKVNGYKGEATAIIANNEMLKFHDNDNRRFYLDEFNKRISKFYEAS
ncbi:MAG: hypothetical protein WCV92_00045 [Candidatus Buchananbacteria bacterium]